MFKKPQILKGLTVNIVLGLLNNVPAFRFLCFFVERNLMDSSYVLWNKFQDYQVKFILIDHFLVKAWPVICRVTWILFADCQTLWLLQ